MIGEFLTNADYRRLLEQGLSNAAPSILFDDEVMRRQYNREPFPITHRLDRDPRFSFDAIAALIGRMPDEHVVCRPGAIEADADFDASFITSDKPDVRVVLARLEATGSYVYARNPECDPVYRPIIEGLVAEIAASLRHLDAPITWYSTYLFVSAQGSVTPYHMDREMNFLLQIRGTKVVDIWSANDPSVMTELEKDRLLSYDGERPPLRPGMDTRASRFVLQAGTGLHHPFIAPHVVRTASELSISLAVTFRTERSDTWTRAHQFNHRVRRLGMHPTAVARHALLDRAKAGTMKLAEAGRVTLRQVAGR